MIPLSILNWAVTAASVFNTILMLWLGLTILLNAERSTWGVWLTGIGFIASAAFFVSHTAIFGTGLGHFSQELDIWWRLGWAPVILSPFAWYTAMLWYAGFWNKSDASKEKAAQLRRRQQPWLWVIIGLVLGLAGLLIFANPLPSYTQVAELRLSATLSVGNIPILIVIYAIFIVLCIVLSLDALRYPAPSERVMGELARRRAWPWLIAASLVLLIVSLLVGVSMFWIISVAHQREATGLTNGVTRTITLLDLSISALIALAVVLTGRAIVSYEVFTGRTLPRRGFFRHWRNVVILAAGYGLVGGGILAFDLKPIYGILIITVSIAPFYALFSWRSYAERKRYIGHLRPFVASQHLYDHLVTPTMTAPPEVDAQTPFNALCADILGARVAYLSAVGPLAPLVGPTLVYPNHSVNLPNLTEITALFKSPQTMGIPLDPALFQGAIWAVPLWSERGLIGLLLLGSKRDGGLYTQEEIEIARASGERLIDTQASAEIARRLMALQRQRLTESQVLDRRTRQVLHDDILPDLHAAMLTLSSTTTPANGNGVAADTVARLADVHHQIADLLRDMPTATAPVITQLGLIGALRQVIDEELSGAFETIEWFVDPLAKYHAPEIHPLVTEVIFYAAREVLRNAAHHARGTQATALLTLDVKITWVNGLHIRIEDNGVGIEAATPSDSGSGQGLALHSTMMAVVGGQLLVESVPERYTRVSLILPQGGSQYIRKN